MKFNIDASIAVLEQCEVVRCSQHADFITVDWRRIASRQALVTERHSGTTFKAPPVQTHEAKDMLLTTCVDSFFVWFVVMIGC